MVGENMTTAMTSVVVGAADAGMVDDMSEKWVAGMADNIVSCISLIFSSI